ncbi:MAG: DUF4241 domain-containing protein [Propionibacteriaceae bacterium]|nr:DUF4241 domain-containing protein [Propionibacteriaceae bacterium]
MDIKDFWALHDGPVPSPFIGNTPDLSQTTVNLTVVDLGTLKVPSGLVDVSDPFVNLSESLPFPVSPGEYPVKVTIADVSLAQDGSHLREAYLSLVLGPGKAVSVEPAEPQGKVNPNELEDGYWCIFVDAGTVGFADAEAVKTCMPTPSTSWYSELFDHGGEDSWFNLMDSPTHYRAGAANIVLPKAEHGENLVLSHSGWGDGAYPVVLTRDAEGNPVGLHIDLQILIKDENDD